MLLSCIVRTQERFGTTYVIDVLRGSREERILRLGHDKLSTYGIGRDRPREDWQHLARHLLQSGYLLQEPEHLVLKLTARGRTALFKREPIFLPPFPRTAPPPSSVTVDLPTTHQPLFERLRSLRKRMADERAVPPYVIFHDRVLLQMAATLPSTRADLLRISGVGERKAADFGDAFLTEIADHQQATGLDPIAALPSTLPRAPSSPRREGVSPTVRRTLELFREGLTPTEISRTRSLSNETIEEHLASAIEEGEELDLNRLGSPQKQDAIRSAMAGLGPSPLLRPIMERLGGDYTYGEIRLVRAVVQQERVK
jgi:ATP-dependent DNA helicase RecQ